MPTRKIPFTNNSYYHVYNRGVERRDIVSDKIDQLRFLRSLNIFNTTEPVGSIFEYELNNVKKSKKFGTPTSKLVEVIAFNLLNNHYHLVLKQLVDNGTSKFIQSLAGGYTKYFNERHDRVGPLFQGPFKASLLGDDRLEEIIAYVNLNHAIHKFGTPTSKWGMRSSWEQYVHGKDGVVEISKWSKFNDRESVRIVNEIIKERNLENLEVGVPNGEEDVK